VRRCCLYSVSYFSCHFVSFIILFICMHKQTVHLQLQVGIYSSFYRNLKLTDLTLHFVAVSSVSCTKFNFYFTLYGTYEHYSKFRWYDMIQLWYANFDCFVICVNSKCASKQTSDWRMLPVLLRMVHFASVYYKFIMCSYFRLLIDYSFIKCARA